MLESIYFGSTRRKEQMYKVVIWGTGQTYHHYINMGKLQEIIKKIRGCIADNEHLYDYLDGYSYIESKQLNVKEYDYVIVATRKYFMEVVKEAQQLGFDREQIIPIKVFAMPCFCLLYTSDAADDR